MLERDRRQRQYAKRVRMVQRGELSWQITARALTDALAASDEEARRVFEALMTMKKIAVARIEAARRG